MVVKGEVGALFLLLALMVLVCGSLSVVVGRLLFVTSNLRLGSGLLLDLAGYLVWGHFFVCALSKTFFFKSK